jgi:GntR family L-lactate dehydrogenase operon transcriptional regulator
MEELDDTHSKLDFAILQSLHTHGQPIGSGTLHYVLRKRGDNLSAPTIGRKLRDLEHRGLVAKVSVEGRILTAAGQKLLHKLDQQRHLENSGGKLLKLLRRGGRKDIIDQLTARRLIESETAALAATNATPEQVQLLEQLIAQGYDLVEHGETGVKADVDFHDTIAEASGNSILAALVIMLRSQVWLNQVIAAIRTKVGGRLVVDHEQIINAIKMHKPDLARKAMEQHLDKLISDVDTYWEQVFPHRDKR